MASSKKRKKVIKSQPSAMNEKTYIISQSRKLPLHQVLIYNNLMEEGIGYAVVSRLKKNGEIIAGFFTIDPFCLGIKDVYYAIFSEEEYEAHKMYLADDDENYFISAEPNYIYNLIYGAADYAEDLGFLPHKDFAIAEYILDKVDEIVYEDIKFGSDGRPFFIEGLNDRTGIILSTLRKNIGEGNFDFALKSEMDEEEE